MGRRHKTPPENMIKCDNISAVENIPALSDVWCYKSDIFIFLRTGRRTMFDEGVL